jgi:hypothetical protein
MTAEKQRGLHEKCRLMLSDCYKIGKGFTELSKTLKYNIVLISSRDFGVVTREPADGEI